MMRLFSLSTIARPVMFIIGKVAAEALPPPPPPPYLRRIRIPLRLPRQAQPQPPQAVGPWEARSRRNCRRTGDSTWHVQENVHVRVFL